MVNERLRLPEPLPYEYVDELLDDNYVFNTTSSTYHDLENLIVTKHSCYPIGRERATYINNLFDLKRDIEYSYNGYPVTIDGYIDTSYSELPGYVRSYKKDEGLIDL